MGRPTNEQARRFKELLAGFIQAEEGRATTVGDSKKAAAGRTHHCQHNEEDTERKKRFRFIINGEKRGILLRTRRELEGSAMEENLNCSFIIFCS